MIRLRGFKKDLASVTKLWEEGDYDAALTGVETLLKDWPGNPHLHILWASLVQLQEDPQNGLDEARQALQRAVDLDRSSPAGSIELGHFLDAVEDKPKAALRAYSEGVASARRLLIEGLIGKAKALRELEKDEEFFDCLAELLHLMHFEPGSKEETSAGAPPDILLESPAGRVFAVQLKGPYAGQLGEILDGFRSARPA